jgi:hypothetical protein
VPPRAESEGPPAESLRVLAAFKKIARRYCIRNWQELQGSSKVDSRKPEKRKHEEGSLMQVEGESLKLALRG